MPKVYINDSERKDAYLRRLIAGYMKDQKITITQLGSEIGIERSLLGKKLNGKAIMYVPELRSICQALQIPGEEVVRGL